MTKITVIGEPSKPEEKKKPIAFAYCLQAGISFTPASKQPKDFKNVELISRNYGNYDLMFAYDDDRNARGTTAIFYLGHWNDGVVE